MMHITTYSLPLRHSRYIYFTYRCHVLFSELSMGVLYSCANVVELQYFRNVYSQSRVKTRHDSE